jgi:hypothetical protein
MIDQLFDRTKIGGYSMSEKEKREVSMEGIVTARTCNSCGHHEIGIVTKDGKFIPLRPGMRIAITER